ncbi:MAG: hypothetical protein PHX21_02215 [bacterium]|nr:hypothetical protein [bacterium]
MKNKMSQNGSSKLILFLSLIIIFSGCKLNNPFTPPLAKGPILDKPINGEKFHPGGKRQFSWKPINKQEFYCVQISQSSTFSSLLIDTTAPGLGNSYNCPHLFSDTLTTKYYWRVKVQTKTYHRWSDWSEVRCFLISLDGNRPPIKPYNPFPDSAATGFSTDSLTLTWDSGEPDGDIVFYTVYFDTNSSFASPDTIIKDSSCFDSATVSYKLPFNLKTATTYYWRVSARDIFNATSVGDIWFFTTEDTTGTPPFTPGAPSIISASPCYVDEPVIATATTTDPENNPILYMFDYGDGSPTHWTAPVASGQAVVDTHIYNVPFHCYGNFYVKVMAKDIGGRQSAWSDSVQVKVKIKEGAIFVGFPNDGPVVHISAKGTALDSIGHQQFPALNPATLCVDQHSGSSPGGDLWVASTYDQRMFRFGNHLNAIFDGIIYGSWTNPSNPSTPCVDKDGNCWIAFACWKTIAKLSPVGNILKTIPVPVGNPDTAFYDVISSIAYDEARGRIWTVEMAITGNGVAQMGRLFLYDTGGTLIKASTYDFCGLYLDIDSTTGECWVANTFCNNIVRVSASGDIIEKFGGFNNPPSLCVDNGKKVWIADKDNHRVVIINFDPGRTMQVINQYNLGKPAGVKVYSPDGSCWVTDSDSCKVIKFNSSGDTLFTRSLSQWGQPAGIAIDYFERE